MNAIPPSFHPGSDADPTELIRLARAFRVAAARTRPGRGQDSKMLRAPFELLCLHAIELAINAALRSSDFDQPTIHAMGHNLSTRARALGTRGLVWKRNSIGIIDTMSRDRHSLKCRYAPAESEPLALGCVEATTDEALEKCAAFVARCEDAMVEAA